MEHSLESYRAILEAALRAGYAFVPFTLDPPPQERVIYLRHDADHSLEMAVEMAQVNADLGISGTFCVLLRSQIYNLLSTWSLQAVERLHTLNQQVALHFSLTNVPPDTPRAVIEERLRGDFAFVQANLPLLTPVFSWHNTLPAVLAWSQPLDEVAGLVNAYAARFTQQIAYFSDTNMRLSVEDFLQMAVSGQHPAMQWLFHPETWVVGGATMRDMLGGVWRYIIREREYEVRSNREYQRMLPDGMPPEVIETFVRAWDAAAQAEGAETP